MVLGEARSKCDRLANVPVPPEYARELHLISLSKGVHATTAIEGNTRSQSVLTGGRIRKIARDWRYQADHDALISLLPLTVSPDRTPN